MIFTLVVAAALITPLALLARNTLRRVLFRQRRVQLVIFIATLIVGAAVGWWLGFTFTYHANKELQILGCPLPLVAFHLEGGNWIDYVMPIPLLNAVLNLIILILLSVAPLNILFRFPREQPESAEKKDSEPNIGQVSSEGAPSDEPSM